MMHSRDSFLDWSMPCGTWFGHRVRLSAFVALIPVVLWLHVWDLQFAALFGLLLISAALIHGVALVFAIRLSGGEAREVLLWPLGAIPRLANSHQSPAPSASIIAQLVSAATVVLCIPALMNSGIEWSILNPLQLPIRQAEGHIEFNILSLFFFANWLVFLANLLPALPMDAGRVLDFMMVARTGLAIGRQIIGRIGMAVGLGVVISALILENVWFCGLGALFLVINLKESLRFQISEGFDESFMGYDFSQGYTSLERSTVDTNVEAAPGFFRQMLNRRKVRRQEKMQAKAEQAERDLDALLAKVHTYGIDSLTDSEKRSLRRMSARYRGRSHG